jgi:tRNA1(Val) A37 N6-methylase TrmN6
VIKSVTFFEMQKPLYELSVKSIALNGLEEKFNAINTKLQDIDKEYTEKFSLIVCNPPYMKVGAGDRQEQEHIAVCRSELTLSLKELISAASKCLKYGGRVNLVHRADRLIEVIDEMKKHGIEPKKLQMVSGGSKEPYLFLIEGVKGGKSGLKILKELSN